MPKNEQASMKNGEDCLKALVAAGADVNVQDARGWTAMMYCVITMHDEITLYLLDHGANPNLANSEGNIALHLAAIDVDLQDPYILDELLAHGAIVDKLDVYGQSPLFYAAYSHKIEWVKGLIAHGANPNIRFWGKHGKTLLDYVNEDSTFLSEEDLKKKRGIIKALKLAGAK
jgi:ankyrin repeat protein